jgi:hypothetical protein
MLLTVITLNGTRCIAPSGLCKCDKINQVKTCSVITLSSFSFTVKILITLFKYSGIQTDDPEEINPNTKKMDYIKNMRLLFGTITVVVDQLTDIMLMIALFVELKEFWFAGG